MDCDLIQVLKSLGNDLLRSPDPSDVFDSQPRSTSTYQANNDRFVLKEAGFDRQFAQTYFCRYSQLKTPLEKAAKTKWPTSSHSRVLGNQSCASEEVFLCGVIFKNMKLKPQALDKYLPNKGTEKELQKNKNRVSDDDILFLEDEGARIELTGHDLPVRNMISGACLAVKGKQVANGKFEVTDLCYPGFAPQTRLPILKCTEDKYVILMSELNLAQVTPQKRISLDLLSQFLTGSTGHSADIPKNIVHAIVCGGLIGKNEGLATSIPNSISQIRAADPLFDADEFLQELTRSIPIDIMPGSNDPATFFMPQQRLHKCLFPRAGCSSILNRVTNPHDCKIDGVKILGSSGQNVADILLHSAHESGVNVLEECLMYQHLAPTCPDTLACFPFNMNDPFVLEETPHVFFAGNQPSFETKYLQEGKINVRLVCVPDFSLTSEAVLVNLRTLETEAMEFCSTIEDN